jgi:hypothetical protein
MAREVVADIDQTLERRAGDLNARLIEDRGDEVYDQQEICGEGL